MSNVLLIDFGSTYTKLTAVDIEKEEIIATGAAYTTIQTDINDGLNEGLKILEKKAGKLTFDACYACSSAAGGLRMVTSGLVPELTGEAAKLASLGAGAKTVGVFTYELTEKDIEEIGKINPDIFLLVGGTDGGNTDCILHNAKMLANMKPLFPIVLAGNRTCASECEKILKDCEVHTCPNVMPKLGVLQIEPTQKKIREIFLKRIIQAKGLSKVQSLLSDIMMPTPSAVLQAIELLANGYEDELGIGELIAVDVGGATTDVYSIADGMPEHANTVYKGLPEPYAKRTVEGDIGMRYSVQGIVDAQGIERICRLSGLSKERALALIEALKHNTEQLPNGDEELEALDFALASCAIDEAVT
ncbi:MAG: glutamate mutase L, partial [Clostridia bacterium]|nr:glutamate mutase L [Clostridia bacterium]